MSVADIQKLRVAELRAALAAAGLATAGLKSALAERLANHYGHDLHADAVASMTAATAAATRADPTTSKHYAAWVDHVLPLHPGMEWTGRKGPKDPEEYRRWTSRSKPPMPTPLELFDNYFDDEMFLELTRETRKQPHHLRSRDRPFFVPSNQPWPPIWTENKALTTWTVEDIKVHVGILITLGALGHASTNVKDMYSANWALRVHWLSRISSRDRFLAFLSSLHCEDQAAPRRPDHNPVPKMGMLLEKFRLHCVRRMEMGENASVDEATAKCNSRFTTMKHKQSHFKPCDGIRVYCLNDSKDAYLAYFHVDTRRSHETISFMFKKVLRNIHGKWHAVHADNAFITVEQLKRCLQDDVKIRLEGTSRTTYGFPRNLVELAAARPGRGEYLFKMAPPGLLATAWHDCGLVKFMSNYHKPDATTIERRVRGHHGKEVFNAPVQAEDYNEFMGGTDDFDFRRAVCSSQRKSKKWWHCLFYFIVDGAKANAYVEGLWKWRQLHPPDANGNSKPYMRPKEFYMAIGEGLMNCDLSHEPKPKRLCVSKKKIVGHRGMPAREAVCFTLDPHKTKVRGNCKYCYLTLKKRKDVWSVCNTCGAHLHMECMRPWHLCVQKFHGM